jgi:hypothetical protein
VAILDGSTAVTDTCTGAAECLYWFRVRLDGRRPAAVGIDAPLSWSIVGLGLRPMDNHLRTTYRTVAKSVLATNSASGSMAIQGMAMALRLRQRWPLIALNETHPKVLVFEMRRERYVFGPVLTAWLLRLLNLSQSCESRLPTTATRCSRLR